MDKQVFERFSRLIYKESGIVLPLEKLNLLSSRISKRLLELKLQDENKYLQIIELDASGQELTRLIDSISTNVTYFYREEAHFKIFRTILASLSKNLHREIKIWCAAASTGEEPYTLAIEASEVLSDKLGKWSICASDICSQALNKAKEGEYAGKTVVPIPENLRNKYFTKIEKDKETKWKINTTLSSKVKFQKLNLVKFPYQLKGPVDIVFIRNVMIYFDRETRAKIIQQISSLLSPGGYIFLSHSENLIGFDHGLERIHSSVFRKPS